jgi:hypothetical protein
MERVVILIEESNTTVQCLLNPESLVVRRVAGVTGRRSRSGRLTGTGLLDDPLIYTGGGRTELDLHLLFDTSLVESGTRPADVREMTAPLWNLAENRGATDQYGAPSLVRFLWGKAWNVPGVITSIAERLEQFAPSGAPQRSWMKIQLVRVTDPFADPGQETMESDGLPFVPPTTLDDEGADVGPGSGGSIFDELDVPSIPGDQGSDPPNGEDRQDEPQENEREEDGDIP